LGIAALHNGESHIMETTLLLIDDETAFADTLEKRLAHRDLKIFKAQSGSDGLKTLSEVPGIDVVLLDVKMPGMDGIQTLKEIKTNYPLVEVIMLTGHATVESAIEGMRIGAFDYLMKPCELDVLLAKVLSAADKKREHQRKILEAVGRELKSKHGL
jgi:DNA-binding NtrC family response regulator